MFASRVIGSVAFGHSMLISVIVMAQSAGPAPTYVVVNPQTGKLLLAVPYVEPPAPPPQILPYEDGANVPEGYAVQEYHSEGLIIAGAVTFGSLYAISFSVASANHFNSTDGPLAVPILGPFLRQSTSCTANGCTSQSGSITYLAVLDALGQATGATMLIIGLIPRKRLVLVEPKSINVVPYISSTARGIGVFGRF